MSRVGKLPVAIPQGINFKMEGELLTFSDGKKTVEYKITPDVKIEMVDGSILVKKASENDSTIFVGTHRSNISNIVEGLSKGFEKILEVDGVGYKSVIKGKMLILSLGYSHDIVYAIPEEIEMKTEKPNLLVIKGHDKVRVGQVAAEIRNFRKPEPYKGKGVKYKGEYIFIKEGKKK